MFKQEIFFESIINNHINLYLTFLRPVNVVDPFHFDPDPSGPRSGSTTLSLT